MTANALGLGTLVMLALGTGGCGDSNPAAGQDLSIPVDMGVGADLRTGVDSGGGAITDAGGGAVTDAGGGAVTDAGGGAITDAGGASTEGNAPSLPSGAPAVVIPAMENGGQRVGVTTWKIYETKDPAIFDIFGVDPDNVVITKSQFEVMKNPVTDPPFVSLHFQYPHDEIVRVTNNARLDTLGSESRAFLAAMMVDFPPPAEGSSGLGTPRWGLACRGAFVGMLGSAIVVVGTCPSLVTCPAAALVFVSAVVNYTCKCENVDCR